MRIWRQPFGWLAVAALSVLMCPAARAQSFAAQAAVSRQEVFVGEGFRFQIQVSGSENPAPPDLPELDGFEVRYLGGQKNSSQSISIINGKMQREVRKGYVFAYELTPTREGTFVIPPVPVRGDGQVAQTQAVTINVRAPMESDDFTLRMELSKPTCYVGEAVTLTVTWYLAQDVRSFQFSLPVLDHPAVVHADPPIDTSQGGPYYRIPLGGDEVIGEKGQDRLDGKDYATITFRKILIPRKPGALPLAPAVVACEALAGYRENRRRSPFGDDLFARAFGDDFFGGGRQGVYRRVSTASNGLELNVLPLPAEGRPAGFAGHVGDYRIAAHATPTEVRVGDPITLTITISGPPYLDHVPLPPLAQQERLAAAFRIPSEISEGQVVDGRKVFTQTIRALHPEVDRIPPIELPYFDVTKGAYGIARSEPIPLHVEAARVVTAEDAEGREPTTVPGRALEGWSRGIAHNVEGPELIRDQRTGVAAGLRSPVSRAGLLGPPLLFLITALVRALYRMRNRNPAAVRARKALRALSRALAGGGEEQDVGTQVLEGLQVYFGDKLGLPSSALTYADIRPRLRERGVEDAALAELERVFRECEAGRYAGARTLPPEELRAQALALAQRLERQL